MEPDPNKLLEVDFNFALTFIHFHSNGTFIIDTNDLALLGSKALYITASLVEHPGTVTTQETIIPL